MNLFNHLINLLAQRAVQCCLHSEELFGGFEGSKEPGAGIKNLSETRAMCGAGPWPVLQAHHGARVHTSKAGLAKTLKIYLHTEKLCKAGGGENPT